MRCRLRAGRDSGARNRVLEYLVTVPRYLLGGDGDDDDPFPVIPIRAVLRSIDSRTAPVPVRAAGSQPDPVAG